MSRRKCSLCRQIGHNIRTCLIKKELKEDDIDLISSRMNNVNITETYTFSVLKERFYKIKSDILYEKEFIRKHNIEKQIRRKANMPEDVSENIIKFIIRKLGDNSCKRKDNRIGDLYSDNRGIIECKWTEKGPMSFGPNEKWDELYILHAPEWYTIDKMTLYKIPLSNSSDKIQKIQINKIKKETYGDQCKQNRRPHINLKEFLEAIKDDVEKVYEGTFDDFFNDPTNQE